MAERYVTINVMIECDEDIDVYDVEDQFQVVVENADIAGVEILRVDVRLEND